MWNQLDTNKEVGGLFPNDGDGNAWGDPNVGVPPAFKAAGYNDHRSRPLPESHRRLLGADQRLQERRTPRSSPAWCCRPTSPPSGTRPTSRASSRRRCSVGKAILFPESVEALGAAGNNLSSEVWWSPNHPFKSSLTGSRLRRARQGLRSGRQAPVDAADRLHPFAVRGGDRRHQARRGPQGSRSARRLDRRDQPATRSSAR